MASNRVIIDSSGRRYRANSFDRFGDDLSQLILSYLTFEDRSRLQCVSKQWMRTIHYRQTQLIIHFYNDESVDKRKSFYQMTRHSKWSSVAIILIEGAKDNNRRLRKLLERCPNVRSIVFRGVMIAKPLLDIIGRYYKSFDSLTISGSHLSDKTINDFGKRFGKKTKEIVLKQCYSSEDGDFISSKVDRHNLLANCPNIESLICDDFSIFVDESQEFLPKLKSLEVIIDGNNASLFGRFVLKYGKQLKRLTLSTDHWDSCETITSDQLVDIFREMSHFGVIQDLNFVVYDIGVIDENSGVINIIDSLEKMANNCLKLRKLRLIMPSNVRFDGNVWQCFGRFRAIRQLDIEMKIVDNTQSIQDLKYMNNLMNLKINCDTIGDKFFRHIAKSVPHLQRLELITRSDLSDNLLIDVSQLKDLRSLTLRQSRKSVNKITDSAFISLLDNCPQLNTFDLSLGSSVTNKSIDKLIALAIERPKHMIRIFLSKPIPVWEQFFVPIVHPLVIPDNLAENLKITVT